MFLMPALGTLCVPSATMPAGVTDLCPNSGGPSADGRGDFNGRPVWAVWLADGLAAMIGSLHDWQQCIMIGSNRAAFSSGGLSRSCHGISANLGESCARPGGLDAALA